MNYIFFQSASTYCLRPNTLDQIKQKSTQTSLGPKSIKSNKNPSIIHVPEDIWARRTKPPVQCLGPLVVASVPTHGSRAVWMAVEFAMVALHSQFSVHRILKRKIRRRRRHLRTCLASDNFIWWSWVLCGVSSFFLSMNVYYVCVSEVGSSRGHRLIPRGAV